MKKTLNNKYLIRPKKTEKFFSVIALFFCFTPFFSPIPIATDVQPVFLIPIFALFLFSRMHRFSLEEITFLVVAMWSILYIDIEDPFFSFRKSLGLLIAFFLYFFFKKYFLVLNSKILFWIVFVNFTAVVFHFLFPQIFADSLGQFVRTIKLLSMEGSRGASGFAAEPGFAGAMAVFYLAVAVLLKESRRDVYKFWLTVFFCLSIVVLSKSGTGSLLLLIFLALMYFRFGLFHIFSGIVLLASLIFLVNVFDMGRAGYAIRLLIEDPSRLFLVDSSVGQRVINISVGFLSVFEFPLGNGAGAYDKVSQYLIDKYSLSYYIAGKTDNISAFAKYSVELGVVFWIFIFYFSCLAIRRFGVGSIKYLAVSLFFISASFSIVFPPVWFLFAALHFKRHYPSSAQISSVKS